MTTDSETTYPGIHYFCVDVETSDLRVDRGDVLSVGMVVMDVDGHVVDSFYRRVDVRGLHPSWYHEELPAQTDTQEWWRSQSPFVKYEAYADRLLPRFSAGKVGSDLRNMVLSYGESWGDRIFVASPGSFDRKWVDTLIVAAGGVEDPFWYHELDMYSMGVATHAAGRKGASKGLIDPTHRFPTHDAEIPHHALSDAFALAQDLSKFLKSDVIDLDAPHYEGYAEYTATLEEAVTDSSLDQLVVEDTASTPEGAPYEEVEPLLDIEERDETS